MASAHPLVGAWFAVQRESVAGQSVGRYLCMFDTSYSRTALADECFSQPVGRWAKSLVCRFGNWEYGFPDVLKADIPGGQRKSNMVSGRKRPGGALRRNSNDDMINQVGAGFYKSSWDKGDSILVTDTISKVRVIWGGYRLKLLPRVVT